MEVKISLFPSLSLAALSSSLALLLTLSGSLSLSAIELTAEIMEVTPTPRGTKSVLQPLTDTVRRPAARPPWTRSRLSASPRVPALPGVGEARENVCVC